MKLDVLVAGGGPAGLALAAEAAEVGLRVQVVDPRAGQPWVPTYGAFLEDLPATLRGLVQHSWSRPLVLADGCSTVVVPRPYGLVHGRRLQATLRERLAAAGGRLGQDRVLAVEPGPRGSGVALAGGSLVEASVVVDATGWPGHLVRSGGGSPAFQVAHGELWEVDAHPWQADEMVLMDFRSDHLPDGAAGTSSFLYAMPLDDRHVFVEETSLAARPAVDVGLLRQRLGVRTAALGLAPRRVLDTEHCHIAMGGELPDPDQDVLPFGAAAGLVHPATGYQLCRALHAAPAVAAALARGLDEGPATARALAWQALWPGELRRARHLHMLGLELLLGLSPADLATFMHRFTSLPAPHQAAYMTGTGSHSAVMSAMAALAPRLPASLLGEVLSTTMGGGRQRLWSAIRPQLGESP